MNSRDSKEKFILYTLAVICAIVIICVTLNKLPQMVGYIIAETSGHTSSAIITFLK